MYYTEFVTLTQLGRLYGVTAKKVGTWLRKARVRDRCGTPINNGVLMTAKRPTPNGYTTFYVWDREATIYLLDSLGYGRKEKYYGRAPTYSGTYRPGKGEYA